APPPPPAPPAPPEPPPPFKSPVPCKVVTLCPSRVTDSVPFDALTAPSSLRLLLEEVVNLSYEAMLGPGTERVSDLGDEPLFTTTTTSSVLLLYAHTYTSVAGFFVAPTPTNPVRMHFDNCAKQYPRLLISPFSLIGP